MSGRGANNNSGGGGGRGRGERSSGGGRGRGSKGGKGKPQSSSQKASNNDILTGVHDEMRKKCKRFIHQLYNTIQNKKQHTTPFNLGSRIQ